jgi:hypothetical protein
MWQDKVIGEVENLSCDNFNIFGKWYLNNSPETARFYEQLKEGNELLVQIGDTIRGMIDEPPTGDELEIKFTG